MVSSHVMAIYLKWHMCPSHEPLVAQIQFVQILLGWVEYSRYYWQGGHILNPPDNVITVELRKCPFVVVVVVVNSTYQGLSQNPRLEKSAGVWSNRTNYSPGILIGSEGSEVSCHPLHSPACATSSPARARYYK